MNVKSSCNWRVVGEYRGKRKATLRVKIWAETNKLAMDEFDRIYPTYKAISAKRDSHA